MKNNNNQKKNYGNCIFSNRNYIGELKNGLPDGKGISYFNN